MQTSQLCKRLCSSICSRAGSVFETCWMCSEISTALWNPGCVLKHRLSSEISIMFRVAAPEIGGCLKYWLCSELWWYFFGSFESGWGRQKRLIFHEFPWKKIVRFFQVQKTAIFKMHYSRFAIFRSFLALFSFSKSLKTDGEIEMREKFWERPTNVHENIFLDVKR